MGLVVEINPILTIDIICLEVLNMDQNRVNNLMVFDAVLDILTTVRRVLYKNVTVFCDKTGASKSTITKMESRKLSLTHVNLENYARALGIDYATVLSFAQEYCKRGGEDGEKNNLKGVRAFLDFLADASSDS